MGSREKAVTVVRILLGIAQIALIAYLMGYKAGQRDGVE